MSTDRVTLPVKERKADQLGSRNVGRLRREGLIPGVVYGSGEPQAIVVGEKELRAALGGPSGLHAIIEVIVDGATTRHAVIKQYQRHPVRGTLTHIDFHEVDMTKPIQAAVSVVLVGESRGAKLGGLVSSVIRELRVEALPTAIPDPIPVHVSALAAGFNQLLSFVEQEVKARGKGCALIFVVDGTDRLRGDEADAFFIRDIHQLQQLRANCLYSPPITTWAPAMGTS